MHGTTARAIRHARSPQRVHRRAQGCARHHSESDPTRTIPAEGSPASSRMCTAPQRERSDTHDLRRGFTGEFKDVHGTTARAIRHARSPQRVHRRAQGCARHHSESAPTRTIPAEGSPASSRMCTAPQRERSDTHDPRRGFTGELEDVHGTTARAIRHARSPQMVRRRAQGWARHHSESDPTRPIRAEGSPASSRMGTAPQRERSDTAQGWARHHSESDPTRPIPARVRRRAQGWARHHSESDPTRPIPAKTSPASSRMGTAPQRERSDTPDPRRGFTGELKDGHGTTARALRHARSPQKVHRRAQGWARHHSESAPTRPIPAEGSSASSRMGTAPQRERSDTPDPRRGFTGELKDVHGTTARAIRHARSPQRVHRRAQGCARHHSESDPTRTIPAEGSPASSRMGTAPQRERSDTHDPRRGFIALGCADPTPG